MAGDGTKANIQDVGDVSVTLTCGQKAEHLNLTLTQNIGVIERGGCCTWPLLKAGAKALCKSMHLQFMGYAECLVHQRHGLLIVAGVLVGPPGRAVLRRQLLNPFAAEACPGIPRHDVVHTEDLGGVLTDQMGAFA